MTEARRLALAPAWRGGGACVLGVTPLAVQFERGRDKYVRQRGYLPTGVSLRVSNHRMTSDLSWWTTTNGPPSASSKLS